LNADLRHLTNPPFESPLACGILTDARKETWN
jgi:hypothetical protein